MSENDAILGESPYEQSFDNRLKLEIAQGLEKSAEAAEGGQKLSLQSAAQSIRESLSWKLEKHWPGLFKLYRTADGQFEATLDERLSDIGLQIRRGLNQSQERVVGLNEALRAILFTAVPKQRFVPPRLDQLPSLDLPTSIFDVHRAARRLFNETLSPCIVYEILQRTFGANLMEVMELPADRRPQAAKKLKKDVCTALDAFFSRSPDEVANNNKAMHKMPSGELRPFSLLAIEEARRWVEKHQQLPTKKQLHDRMLEEYPGGFPQERTWPKILKEAGLDGLPAKMPWKRDKPARNSPKFVQ